MDSLCIIQDKQSDWEIECALMHQIFAFSALTIAANDEPNAMLESSTNVRNLPGIAHSSWMRPNEEAL